MKCTVSIILLVGVVLNVKAEQISWEAFSAASSPSNISLKGQYVPLIGSPQVGITSSNDCGSTYGTLPDMLTLQATQLGCAGPFKKQDISLKLTTPGTSSYSNMEVCFGGSDNACENFDDPNLLCNTYSTPKALTFPSCLSDRCCVRVRCLNIFGCSGAYAISYNSTFATTLLDSVLAGIIVGSILIVACCVSGISYCCCCRHKNIYSHDTQQVVVQATQYSPQVYQQQYQGTPQQSYQQGGYQQGYQGGYQQQQSYQQPYQGYQQQQQQQQPYQLQQQQQGYNLPQQSQQNTPTSITHQGVLQQPKQITYQNTTQVYQEPQKTTTAFQKGVPVWERRDD